MIHLTAVLASSHYADVFQTPVDWVPRVLVLSMVTWMLLIFPTIFSVLYEARKWLQISLVTAIVVTGITSIVCGAIFAESSPWQIIHSHMSDNIKQKYGVTLDKDSAVPASDKLTQPNPYQLDLPNGTKGTYSIQWDKATREPTIVNSPTFPPLSQNAK